MTRCYYRSILLCLAFALWQHAVSAKEAIVVVVNSANPIEQMTRSEVIDLFMGKYVAFPDGEKAVPVDLDGEQPIKQQFYHQLVGRSLASINAYWSRLRFTGRVKPSIQKNTEQQVVQYITNNNDAIGYIPISKLTKQLKVVYQLNE
ncbi:hypothetical protein [Thalassotalea sp. G2M2-11]|uniref:hypothetical protein n=1 Tax=Thalassotalea sp. G2M2-11 TaxID=2787627 RepID=UPI0019CFA303|nr:hypothetical protein [Thalassotalea sp. G2M2-11]